MRSYCSSKSRGATLTEILIAISVIGVFAVVVLGAFSGLFLSEKSNAEPAARQWGTQLGLNVVGVSCADRDSDNDGYVSCTISAKEPNGSVTVHPVECARTISFNSGCRTPKMRIPNSN